ncbi:MAG: chemotaxis protein CheW [Bacteroidales bacterium]|nr:chemotaxis protein CheW [Bacteroidales bacterium]
MDYKESFILFRAGGRNFAVSVTNVLEVTESKDISPLPGAPDYVAGIKVFRDEVIPVVNTIERLDFKREVSDDVPGKYVAVFEISTASGKKKFGILIDKVMSVSEMNVNTIKISDDIDKAMAPAPYIRGVVNSEHGFIYVLLPEYIFSKTDLQTIDEVMPEGKQ